MTTTLYTKSSRVARVRTRSGDGPCSGFVRVTNFYIGGSVSFPRKQTPSELNEFMIVDFRTPTSGGTHISELVSSTPKGSVTDPVKRVRYKDGPSCVQRAH